MKNVLVIGGTKYLGLEFIKILDKRKINFFVASRKKIDVNNFIEIDRKNQNDLDQLFIDNQFDVVIDFINYSGLDSEILLNSLSKQIKPPKLILISTVYTYALPTDIDCDSLFKEVSFNPLKHENSNLDRPDVTYSEGKRDMESYCIKNYRNDKLVILRFPIILGANDYTNRTQFYINKIKNRSQINPININNKSCYIFTYEAANSIVNFVNNEKHGIFNVSYKAISEFNLIKLYCNYFNFKIGSLINFSIESSDTPFSSNYDFIVDNNKYHNNFPLKDTFENALNRELSKINKK
jgi:nucleoside-diphosphate-sugar epimerase